MINLTIDGKAVTVTAGTTILAAAQKAGIDIPTLCYLKDQSVKANCRICLVEVKGGSGPVPACASEAVQGMEVITDSAVIIAGRRRSLQLILTHHPIACQSCVRLGNSRHGDLSEEMCSMCFYCDCVRDGDCELQKLLKRYDVNGMDYVWAEKEYDSDTSTSSIVRDPGKCILCRRCVSACGEVQGIYAWSITGRGFHTAIESAGGGLLAESPCVECGQCVRSCPVGALYETQNLDDLPDAAQDPAKTVIARADPYFLKPYLRLAELDEHTFGDESLSAGLRRIGVDLVIGSVQADQAVNTDITAELKKRLSEGDTRPLLSATCPASVQYLLTRFPQLSECLSAVPGAQEQFGSWAKANWGNAAYTLSLSACSAKKMAAAESVNVDQVMSPREINRLFGRSGADLNRLKPVALDEPQQQECRDIPDSDCAGIQEREVILDNQRILIASACGLRAVANVLELAASGNCPYRYIQVAACPQGCQSAGDLPYETL